MNRKELSEVIAEAAAKTEAAAARTEVAVALAQEARAHQEAATARWEATQADAAERNEKLDGLLAKQDKLIAKADEQLAEMRADRARAEAEREDERIWRTEYLRRQEKMFQEFFKRAEALVAQGTINTEKILVAIRDQQDDIRAMKEAIFKLIDRFPPPPPHLRSA